VTRARSENAQLTLALALGSTMLKRLDGLEELDRISPGCRFETQINVGSVRFMVTAKVVSLGVKV